MARRNPSLIAGGAIVAMLALAAALGPLVVRIDPLAIDLTQVLAPPSRGHWLGCDALGRDLLARVLWGARLSLAWYCFHWQRAASWAARRRWRGVTSTRW